MTLVGGLVAEEQAIRGVVNQVADSRDIWHVYAETAELKVKFSRVVEGDWRIEPPGFIGCNKKVRTVEDTSEQVEIIRQYHEGETNHRGVRETWASLAGSTSVSK